MIAILSCDDDPSTDLVIDWLRFNGEVCIRLNGEQLLDGKMNVNLINEHPESESTFSFCTHINGTILDNYDCNVVWYRRWGTPKILFKKCNTYSVEYRLLSYLLAQFKVLSGIIYDSLVHCTWLNHPSDLKKSKLNVLNCAKRVGLKIPATIICSCRNDLVKFKEKYGRVITKSIGEADYFNINKRTYSLYTTEVKDEDLSKTDAFFPSLVQEMIEKDYELRVFFLKDKFYSMAIFSQNNQQTEVDFRRYDSTKPNRRVPYLLPSYVQDKLIQLMKILGINCGSIDMIKSTRGDYVFLEVNPVGQFGMVSIPCNYYLEKEISDSLINARTNHDKV